MSQESNPFTASETTSPPLESAGNPYQSPTVVDTLQPTGTVPNPETLRGTRSGLFTVYYGICILLFGTITGAVLLIAAITMRAILLAAVGGILMTAGMILGSLAILVGQVFCLTIPRESGAKGFIQASVGMQALAILFAFGLTVASQMIAMPSMGLATNSVMIGSNFVSLFNGILGLGSFVCFLFFMKRAANFVQRSDLAKTASTVFKMVVGTVIAYFLIIALAIGLAYMGGGTAIAVLFGILMIVVLLFAVVTFVRYGNLTGTLARAIPTH